MVPSLGKRPLIIKGKRLPGDPETVRSPTKRGFIIVRSDQLSAAKDLRQERVGQP